VRVRDEIGPFRSQNCWVQTEATPWNQYSLFRWLRWAVHVAIRWLLAVGHRRERDNWSHCFAGFSGLWTMSQMMCAGVRVSTFAIRFKSSRSNWSHRRPAAHRCRT